MTTVTEHVYKEYRIPLGDDTLVLNESAYQALQYLIKQAKREALMEAADKFRTMDSAEADWEGEWASDHLRKMAEEL